MVKRWVSNWIARHRNRTNFLLHMAGIPATVAAVPVAVLGNFLLAAGLLVAGYALQFLGHFVEGNRSGEELLLRRLLKRD
ncbi:MAG TPA: Mpo1-like protein [Phycisphaerae bacterium]|nr:Mpo1-like protein [Phycisphaerae bacterium]